MKPLFKLAAVGLVGFAAVKLVGFLFAPLIGIVLGLVFTVLKIALIIALIYIGFHFFRKIMEPKAETPTS
jgi:hypothetical protein